MGVSVSVLSAHALYWGSATEATIRALLICSSRYFCEYVQLQGLRRDDGVELLPLLVLPTNAIVSHLSSRPYNYCDKNEDDTKAQHNPSTPVDSISG